MGRLLPHQGVFRLRLKINDECALPKIVAEYQPKDALAPPLIDPVC